MASNPTNRIWTPPQDGVVDKTDLRRLQQSVNAPKGLHGDTIVRSLTVDATDRLLLLGDQRIPNGVSLRIAGVCRIL